jgi:hypothetical protein
MLELLNGHFMEAGYSVYAQNILLVTVPVLVALVLRYAVSHLAHRKARQTDDYSFLRSLIRYLVRPITLWLPLLFIKFALPAMDLEAVWAKRIDKALDIALIIAFAWILTSLVNI